MNFLKSVVVKEELVALTGNMVSAIILNQFIYWSQRIKDFDSFIKEENKRREKNDMDSTDTELQNGWIYKELGELKDEIMFTCSSKTVGRKLEILLNNGWLNRRNNPKYKWDRTYQYRVDLLKIAKDLNKIGYVLQDYKIDLQMLGNSNSQFDSCSSQEKQEETKCLEPLKISNRQDDFSIDQDDFSIGQVDSALPEITTEITTEIKNHSIIREENQQKKEIQNEQTQKDDRLNELINKLELSSLETKDKAPVLQSIKVLYSSKKGITSNGISVKPSEIRENLKHLEYKHIEQGLKDYQEASNRSQITNPTSYLGSCIYNAIFKPETKKTTYRDNIKPVNTKFHNFEQRTSKYSAEELERMILKRK